MKWYILPTIMMCLVACGGGSDSGSTSPARPAPPAPSQPPVTIGSAAPIIETENLKLFGQASASVGESVGFAIISKGADINVQWQQSSGPEVQILADKSQAMGFDVPAAGEYSFVATLSSSSGLQETYTLDLTASGSDDVEVNVRLDHAVTELAKVSLNADISSEKAVANVVWEQLSGPQVQALTIQDRFVFFNAPSVSQDALIEMQARVEFSDGSSAVDHVLIAVKNVEFQANGLFSSNNFFITEDMRAYQPNSPYKGAIERCVYNNQIPGRPNCTFNDLPLIGSVTENPSVQDILDRTLVSHDWMGDSFKYYLENSLAGADMLRLLRGVTAIVISYDVRPSFYWAATGAIYLDANNFWQTPAERDTLNDQPDFRSDFGSDLQFSVFWRYTKNNDYYPSGRYAKSERSTRSFRDFEASISWLMYHELAHANDFFPPSEWQRISGNTTPLAYFQNNGANSDELDRLFPLRSSEMHALANVSFGGQSANAQQRNYRGVDIERFFTPDIAPSYYAYYTTREDFATLVERFLMLHRLGAEADIAIIDGQSNDDFTVIWGQRNRISDPALRDRTALAVSKVYPELGNVSLLQSQLPPPRLMDPANGWFGNLSLSSAGDERVIRQRKFDMDERATLDQRQPHLRAPTLQN